MAGDLTFFPSWGKIQDKNSNAEGATMKMNAAVQLLWWAAGLTQPRGSLRTISECSAEEFTAHISRGLAQESPVLVPRFRSGL